MLPESLTRLVERLQRLPGIGAKGAQRLNKLLNWTHVHPLRAAENHIDPRNPGAERSQEAHRRSSGTNVYLPLEGQKSARGGLDDKGRALGAL